MNDSPLELVHETIRCLEEWIESGDDRNIYMYAIPLLHDAMRLLRPLDEQL